MAHLSITAFGSLQVMLDGKPITTLAYNKVRALLIYLALTADRAHERAALAGLLWPDQPELSARTNLRQALAHLRQAIGDQETMPFLLSDREHIQFNAASDHTLDVAIFQELLAACDVHSHRHPQSCAACVERRAQAVALYSGVLLDKFSVGDSDLFEEWVLLTREHLHRQALDSLTLLTTYHEQRGAYAQALDYSTRLLELDPWREEAYRQTMRILALDGQRSAALAHYERCRKILAEELGVEPAAETLDLVERIRNNTLLRTGDADPFALPAQRPHNLPLPPTPFLGREKELALLAERLVDPHCRLLTLVGPGGVGKTRLALQAATEQIDAFADGVTFVALAGVSTAKFLAPAVATALHVNLTSDDDPQQQLLHFLRTKEILLVLDNFEQLLTPQSGLENPGIGDGVEFLVAMLEQAPGVTLLVTSRERLNLRGEWVFAVQGLQVPDWQHSAALEKYSAAALFLQQAHRVQADFVLAEADRAAVVHICHLVQGIPLAIELAAAWLRVLSCQEIANEIEGSLGFLTTTLRDVLPRHRSLQAVFDHSWQLLTPDEQRVLARCSVFRSGFTRAAAADVTGASLRQLATLVDKSLLRHRPEIAANRGFDIHELTRQYAYEQLENMGETAALRDQHLTYYRRLVEEADHELRGRGQLAWLRQLDWEYENLRAALQWGLQDEPPAALRLLNAATLATALIVYWTLDVDWREGRYWLEAVARLLDQHRNLFDEGQLHEATILRAKALYGAGVIAWDEAEYEEAKQLLNASAELWRAAGDRIGLLHTQVYQADLLWLQGDRAMASTLWQESLDYFRHIENGWSLAETLVLVGDAEQRNGNLGAATHYYEEAKMRLQALGERWLLSLAEFELGVIALAQEDYERAWPQIEQWLTMAREFGLRHQMYVALGFLACIPYRQGDIRQAERLLREALAIERQGGYDIIDHLTNRDKVGIAALVCAINGQYERAISLLAALLAGPGPEELPIKNRCDEQLVMELRTQIDADAFAMAWAAGATMMWEEALALAIAKQ
jgi:predicted ATPase